MHMHFLMSQTIGYTLRRCAIVLSLSERFGDYVLNTHERYDVALICQ
jgi:hypothetical protein